MSTGRYEAMFASLNERVGSNGRAEGAFVPFVMLGDPNAETSLQIIEALIAGGADALELGVPFSDPVADGPTIQAAHIRALEANVDVDAALGIVAEIRRRHPDLPMGLLIYGNVAFARGMETFYNTVAAAGADSVLLPDIPVREGEPFVAAAHAAGIDQIFIAPPHAAPATLEGVAANSTGYIYAVSRVGVTGAENESSTDGLREVIENLQRFGGAPALLGFGISTPEHVRAAVEAGAAGAISGSAVTGIVAEEIAEDGSISEQGLQRLTDFVRGMKEGTRV